VAVGVGGYASGPILKAAARKGVPVLIQEQNSYAGVTNKLLARSAQKICVAYEKMDRYFPGERIVLTGNPVRKQLVNLQENLVAARQEFGLTEGRKVCLVVGGSLGAKTLNESFLAELDKLERSDVQVLWQCGKYYREEVEARVKARGLEHVKVFPFISRMDLAYGIADVIVSRAGAITISELCLVGKPVILVPSPNVAEDHQTRNAEALVEKDAAILVPDSEAVELLVDEMLGLIGNTEKQEVLSEHIKQLGIADAAERIASEVFKIVKQQ